MIKHYTIEGNGGCCRRVTIVAMVVVDGKATFQRISEHNSRAVAERKLEKLERALAALKA